MGVKLFLYMGGCDNDDDNDKGSDGGSKSDPPKCLSRVLAFLLGIGGNKETKLPLPFIHSNKVGDENDDDNDDNDGGNDGVREGGSKSDPPKCL